MFLMHFLSKKSFRLLLGQRHSQSSGKEETFLRHREFDSRKCLQEHDVFLRFSIYSTPFQICENARDGKFTHICIQKEALRGVYFVLLCPSAPSFSLSLLTSIVVLSVVRGEVSPGFDVCPLKGYFLSSLLVSLDRYYRSLHEVLNICSIV